VSDLLDTLVRREQPGGRVLATAVNLQGFGSAQKSTGDEGEEPGRGEKMKGGA